MSIGFSLNPVDWVSDAAESLWDIADDIPGVAALGDGFEALVTGPLRDLANTAAGKVVLRALSGSVYAVGAGALGPFVGPPLASVAFALPGLARGEDFWSAWFEESLYRAKTAAEIAGPGVADDAMKTREIQKVLGEIQKYAGTLLGQKVDLVQLSAKEVARRLGVPSLSVEAVAARFGITDYAAAKALNGLLPNEFPLNPSDYTLSGRRKKGLLALVGSNVNFFAPPSAVEVSTLPLALKSALTASIDEMQAEADAQAAAVAATAALESATVSQTRANVALVGVATAGMLAFAGWYFNKR